MSNLSLKDFNNLTEKEKSKRYKELSEHDKFLVRTSMNPGIELIGHEEVTKEETEWANKILKEVLNKK